MPYNSFQLINTPRLYVSYPLWQYTNGGLTHLRGYVNQGWGNIPDEDLIKVLHLDPSDTIRLDWTEGSTCSFNYGLLSEKEIETTQGYNSMPFNLWNFNYAMVLNHNFATANVRPYPRQDNIDGTADNSYNITRTSIVNYANDPADMYDGFTIMDLTNGPIDYLNPVFRLGLWNPDTTPPEESQIDIGTIMFGRYFDFPQSVEVDQTFSYKYDVKNRKNTGGKTIPTKKWKRPKSWPNRSTGGTEPFGLRNKMDYEGGQYWDSIADPNVGDHSAYYNNDDNSTNFRRRTGKRVWNIRFASLLEDDVMSQNPMLNSYGFNTEASMLLGGDTLFDNQFTGNIDNYVLTNDSTLPSEYTIDKAVDFYTNVVHRTNGGQIPMVLQLDKNIHSPEKFAIVKMSEYSIKQKGPKYFDFKITLEEQ